MSSDVSQSNVEARSPSPCAGDPRYRALDFWIGSWIARVPSGEVVGENVIISILEGCVLSENWTGARGLTGKSYSFFNAARETWQQTWVDDRGTVTEFTHGTSEGETVVFLTGDTDGADGQRRLTFTRIDDDHVRQLSEVAAGGAWDVEYDLRYERQAAEVAVVS